MDSTTLRERLTWAGYDGLRGRLGGGGPESPSGADTLFRARYGCYLVLGFEPEQALLLAAGSDASVLDVLHLIEDGCPHETAVAILV